MVIRWDSESDWQNEQDSSGAVGRNGNLKQGYSRERPDLSTDLVGYWPLHDNSATDYSGNNNHGSLNGGITTGVAGKAGLQAMSFDGNDDYISGVDTGNLDGSSDYTVVAWVRPASTHSVDDYNFIYSDRQDANMYISEDSGKWSAYHGGSSSSITLTSSNSIQVSEWTQIAFRFRSGDSASLFENASQVDSTSHSITDANTKTQGATISRKPWDSSQGFFDGAISELRVYNRALSNSEIQTLYQWGHGDFARPLNNQNSSSAVSRWAFDGNANDSWSENDGSVNGASFVDDSIRGQSADFDRSSNDNIQVSDSSSLNLVDWTVSAWVKFDSFDNELNGLVVKSDVQAENTNYEVRAQSSRATADFGDGNDFYTASSSKGLSTGIWYHLAGTYNQSSGILRIYINGNLEGETDTGGVTPNTNTSSLKIGYQEDNDSERWHDGHIDDVRIYREALNPSEIFQLYRWGTKGRDMRKYLVNH